MNVGEVLLRHEALYMMVLDEGNFFFQAAVVEATALEVVLVDMVEVHDDTKLSRKLFTLPGTVVSLTFLLC
jgi:hypothetical protein